MAESQAQDELRAELQQRFQGEIRLDPYHRALYSTDASNHQITPIGVAFPRHGADLAAIVETAAELKLPLLPRGAGTSLAGSAVGEALVLDCSRHLNQIHGIDPERQVAEVGPGVVCNQLNAAASQFGLQYGPDPASADRATFGGMIGTNATGAHSIRYGMTADHVQGLEVVLADGSEVRLQEHSLAAARSKAAGRGLEAGIHREALRIRQQYAQAVVEHWPRTWRRSSGYSLNYLTGYTPSAPAAWYAEAYPPHGEFNLAPLLCGSEGTLAIIRRAQVKLVPRPAHSVLLVIGFDSAAAASDFTPAILETEPAAVELLPRLLIERARAVPAYSRRLGFVEGDPQALLVVEYTGDTPQQAEAKAESLRSRGRLLLEPAEQNDLWTVRKAGLGLLMSVPGDAKPITFMEDVAVPVEQLGRYVREVERLLAEHGTHGEWYAHASAGCLHMRPLINLKRGEGVRRMRAIADQVVELVVQMRGAISGEHGDGLSHTAYNRRLFGAELSQAFVELKQAFDPGGILNPGKVVPGSGEGAALDADLRLGPDYQADPPATFLEFRKEGGFQRAVESCIGVGICRKAEGVMCPSFQATRLEMHSTRGRANALREAISGRLPEQAFTSHEMYEILDLCLECKGCKSECPTEVDMARMKAEFLHHYQAEHGVPLRSRLFGEVARLLGLLQRFAPIANWAARSGWFRRAQQLALGIASQRTLPSVARRRFRAAHRASAAQGERVKRRAGGADTERADIHPPGPEGEQVVLFVDTYTEFSVPQVGAAAVALLEAAGCQVELAPEQICCGRPLISKGLLGRAREQARRNVAGLAEHARAGVPILGVEPSCVSALRDEYLELLPGDDDARAVAGAARLIEEYLTERGESGERRIDRVEWNGGAAPIMLHNHCHAKSLVGSEPLRSMLAASGAAVNEIDSGCCGMAGSFGYEAEHYELSMQIGELKLFPAVRDAPAGAELVAPGFSCRAQIHDGTGAVARHPLELLAERLASA